MFAKITLFLTEHLWRLASTGNRFLDFLLRPLRFVILVVRSCVRDGAMLHASALTYITMLAIVPVLALGLTSLKAFGAGDLAEQKMLGSIDTIVSALGAEAPVPAEGDPLITKAAPAPTIAPADADTNSSAETANALNAVCRAVFDRINSINFAQIGVVGAAALIFMVISVIGKIENSFNAIWGVRKARPIWRKFTDYLSVIIIAPLLLIAATSLPILSSLTEAIPNFLGLRTFFEAIGIFNILVPLLLGTSLFAFLFGFLPNTRVKIPSCFVGGFITVVAITIFFKICFAFQVGIANNSAIYGSLAALPILLFWIYFSWLIILIGAEICYVHQYRHDLTLQSAFSHPSHRDTITLALALTLGAAHATQHASAPLRLDDFAKHLSLSERDVLRVAAILERNQILLPIADANSSLPAGYVLAQCATVLTPADVINACLDDAPGEDLLKRTNTLSDLHPLLLKIDTTLAETLNNAFHTPIVDIIRKATDTAKKA